MEEREFSPEFLKEMEEEGTYVISDQEFHDIPHCVCCDFEDLIAYKIVKNPEPYRKKGRRFLFGASFLCRACDDSCDPNAPACSIDDKKGRKVTMDGVLDWFLKHKS